MPDPTGTAASFAAILARELREIRKRRAACPTELEDIRKWRADRAKELRDIRKQRKAGAATLNASGPPSETRRPEELFPRREPVQRPSPCPPQADDATGSANTDQQSTIPGRSRRWPVSSILEANHTKLLGLAFSGGGIRSATFNLGVLQGLARRKLLHRFDYLSTISGGGYIGAWLTAWIYRRGMVEVETRLGAERRDQPQFKDPSEIGFLREYSNYLTPRKGFLGADTWTAIAIYLRNLVLNLLVLILFIAAILLAPRALTTFVQKPPHWFGFHAVELCLVAFLVISILAVAALRLNMRNYGTTPQPDRVLARVREKASKEYQLQVDLLPGGTGSQFDELLQSQPRIEIWDPSITRRRDVRRSCKLACFIPAGAAGVEKKTRAGAMNFTLPVSADPRDLVIAVYPGMAKAKRIVYCVAVPLFTAAVVLACLIARYGRNSDPSFWRNSASMGWWAVAGAASYAALWFSAIFRNRSLDKPDGDFSRRLISNLSSVLSPWISGAAGALLLWKLAPTLEEWSHGQAGMWNVLGFGAPLVTLILLASSVLQMGLLGVVYSEPRREWWARLAAILMMICFVWAAAFALAGYSPLLLLRLRNFPTSRWLAALTWVASTGLGILGGKSSGSGTLDSHTAKDVALSVTPYVFIVGLLMLVSLGIHMTLMKTAHESVSESGPTTTAMKISGSGQRTPEGNATLQVTITQKQTASVPAKPYWDNVEKSLSSWVYLALAICLAASFLLALRVDLNEFSMHYLYRNRLVRCYLGASNRERVPNPFTGFDVNDDIHLAKLTHAHSYDGPIPIFGAALNLVHGKDLAWQERKAESFVMTPLFCGFDVWFEQFARPGQWDKRNLEAFGYRRTQNYAYPQGFYIGTAMAISGAAASPNMGYHSSPALGFLMTVFNVRLGWWVGNPRHSKSWRNAGPLVGLGYLLAELFGGTDDSGKYVYLSDGGHFENLGLYELVKRRCRFILVSDTGADKDLTFGDLASAIRKCRSDMGIEIKLRTDRLHATGKPPYSKWHCAVGDILYQGSDPDAENGVLLYIKASLTSDEPADVLNYKSRYPDFPHQSTADQWFTESQFEGYRALGQHVIESVIQGLPDTVQKDLERTPVKTLFEELGNFWKNSEEIQAVRWPPDTGP